MGIFHLGFKNCKCSLDQHVRFQVQEEQSRDRLRYKFVTENDAYMTILVYSNPNRISGREVGTNREIFLKILKDSTATPPSVRVCLFS